MKLVTKSNQIQIGDVIAYRRERNGKLSRPAYGLVIRIEQDMSSRVNFNGFYYVRCNRFGEITVNPDPDYSAGNYVFHSNMLLGDAVKVVRTLDLPNSFGMPSTGVTKIDNYLALLDGRYNAFVEHAPKEMQELFDKNQDRNFHSENALMVAMWYQNWSLHNINAIPEAILKGVAQ